MRVAIIGLGAAGEGLHLPALAGIPSIAVVGGCDVDTRRRERIAARWRIPVFPDPDQMLATVHADVVVVATPPASHAALCLQALGAGAHVVCEKPFVSSLEEADRVIAAAATAGKHVIVNHEFSEMPIFRALVDRIGRGSDGDLRFVQAWQMIDLPPWSESGWRGQMAERTLFEAGVHLVDIILRLFGERPAALQASMSRGANRGRQHDAIVLATFEFSGGRLAQLTQNRLSKGACQYLEVRADTEQASFRASFGGRARISAGLFRTTRPHLRVEYGVSGIAWREADGRRKPLAKNPKHPNLIATREVLKHAFASALARTASPGPSVVHAREVLEVVAGCYRAAMTGERVVLDATELRRLRDVRMGALSGA